MRCLTLRRSPRHQQLWSRSFPSSDVLDDARGGARSRTPRIAIRTAIASKRGAGAGACV